MSYSVQFHLLMTLDLESPRRGTFLQNKWRQWTREGVCKQLIGKEQQVNIELRDICEQRVFTR